MRSWRTYTNQLQYIIRPRAACDLSLSNREHLYPLRLLHWIYTLFSCNNITSYPLLRYTVTIEIFFNWKEYISQSTNLFFFNPLLVTKYCFNQLKCLIEMILIIIFMNTFKEIWLKIKIKMKNIIGNTNCKRIYILIIEKIERIRN